MRMCMVNIIVNMKEMKGMDIWKLCYSYDRPKSIDDLITKVIAITEGWDTKLLSYIEKFQK